MNSIERLIECKEGGRMNSIERLMWFSTIISAVFAGNMLTLFAVLTAVKEESWTKAAVVPLLILIGLDIAGMILGKVEARFSNSELETGWREG